jgi:hypothetical protein
MCVRATCCMLAAARMMSCIPSSSLNAGGVLSGAERQGQGCVCRGQARAGGRVHQAGGGRAVTAGL